LTVSGLCWIARNGGARGSSPGAPELGVAVPPILSRAMIAGLVVLALGLSGCGRKSALEPPPSASVTSTDGTTAPAPDAAPEKPNQPFFLDWLL
jgi:predicted small lipoprotein YifL